MRRTADSFQQVPVLPVLTPSGNSKLIAAVNLRRFYQSHPRQCTDTELACLLEGRQAVVGDPQRWFHLYFPDQPYRENLQTLVVGSGSLEAARLAAGARQTSFLAVDQDETTLDQLDRVKQHYRLDNLDLMWLGADQIQVLDRKFDLIFCPERLPPALSPGEFLRLARERLAPGGALNLTTGGSHGSAAVTLLHGFLSAAGIDVEAAEPAVVRQWIDALPASHPFHAAASGAPELVHDTGLIDRLRSSVPAFSVPELYALLERSGLRLQRFLCQAQYMPECCNLRSFLPRPAEPAPDSESECAELFALTELFRGTLGTHTVIAGRADRSRESFAICFAGAAWREYKPVRNPGLEIVTENLPADTAAYLRWAVHDDPAISLAVDERQARLFDAIDGTRTITDLAAAADLESGGFARDFFHDLWRRDYVWFQIPPAGGTQSGRENAP